MNIKKYFILCLFLLSIIGCKDTQSLIIEFNKDVTQIKQTEEEIKEALNGIAIVDGLSWLGGRKRARLKFYADESNLDYSIEQVSRTIMSDFYYQNQDVTLTITITENDEALLKELSLKKGQVITRKLNWNKATTDAYYSQSAINHPFNHLLNERHRSFFCAIEVLLYEDIPSLQHYHKFEGPGSLMIDGMMFTASYEATIAGLPLENSMSEFSIHPYFSMKHGASSILLNFENLGRTESTVASRAVNGSSMPENATKESCEEIIRTKFDSNLLSAAGSSANGNVLAVSKEDK